MERSARGTKEKMTKKGPRDLQPFIVVHRGDDPVALVTLRKHERDEMLNMVSVCAGMFRADAVGLAFETWEPGKNLENWNINPLTGREWAMGEMDDVVKNHDALSKGWIVENVSVMCANRAGDLAMRQMPFKYVGGKHLHWLDGEGWSSTDYDPEIVAHRGVMPEAMVEIMRKPDLDQVIEQVLPGLQLDRDERDYGAAKFIGSLGHAVLIYSDADDRQRRSLFGTGWRRI